MGRQRPATVTGALRVQWSLVVLGAVATLVTLLQRDALLADWAETRGGLDAVEQSGIAVPAFVPVAVVTFIVYAALVWVLVVLFRQGHGWARWSLLALAGCCVFAAFITWRAEPPTSFVVLSALATLGNLAVGWLLLQPDSSDWVRGAELAEEHEHAG